MSTVLVIHATRMGGTAEIAKAPAPDRFDAVVLGSAIYLGHWLSGATEYLSDHRAVLARRPVLLFQSGPCGEDAGSTQAKVPGRVARLSRVIGCPPPITFGGVLESARATGRISRWMADGPLAGDYRDWDRISAWAERLADQLEPPTAAGTAPVAWEGSGLR